MEEFELRIDIRIRAESSDSATIQALMALAPLASNPLVLIGVRRAPKAEPEVPQDQDLSPKAADIFGRIMGAQPEAGA